MSGHRSPSVNFDFCYPLTPTFLLILKILWYKLHLTLLATASFSRGCQGRGDSFHHFETPIRASFDILTSSEIIPLMTHERRPRIQKMKCLAQKLTKWRRIENLWQNVKLKYFHILRDLRYVNVLPTFDKATLISPRMIRFGQNWSLWLRNYK